MGRLLFGALFMNFVLGCTQAGTDVVRRSKLNFVDLAGSERPLKTGLAGESLREAKHINLSLHFLEQVKRARVCAGE